MDPTAKLLEAAAEAVGGEDQLAERFAIRAPLMRAYMEARLPLPDELFLKAVDLILWNLDAARRARQLAAQSTRESPRDPEAPPAGPRAPAR
jgi:hypothetical protein